MSTPPQQTPLLHQAVATWFRMDAQIGTPLAERAWREHWDLVLRLRRSYVLFCLGVGLLTAGIAAMAVTLLGLVWQQGQEFPWSVLPLALAPLVLGPWWRHRTAVTVAPFVAQRRHVWPRWLFGLVFPVALVLAVFVPWSPVWAAASGLLCALPWWLGAILEQRRPAPPCPAAWLGS